MKEGLPKKPPKESKVEAPMLRDTKDPKQFAEEHGALVRGRIARRLQILQEDRAARLAATNQEPKPEPAADPAVVSDVSIDLSSSTTTDPVNLDNDVDTSGPRPGRRRGKKQEPAPMTPAVQPTPAAKTPLAPAMSGVLDVADKNPPTFEVICPQDVQGLMDRNGLILTGHDLILTRDSNFPSADLYNNGENVRVEFLAYGTEGDLMMKFTETTGDVISYIISRGVVMPTSRRVEKSNSVADLDSSVSSTIDKPADVKIADAADTMGVPDGLLDPQVALSIQNAVDAQNAQQADATVANATSDPSLNIADPVVIVQPRRRQVNKPGPAVAAAVVAAGATVSVAAGGRIPAGIDPDSLPVLNEPLSDDFDKNYNIEGMTLAPKEDAPKGLELVPKDGDPLSSTPEAIVPPETPASGEAPKVETPETEAMSEIERLKLLVDGKRMAYVSVDYKQKSKWKKLRNFFGIKSEELADGDTNAVLSDYRQALTAYQEAQLAAIKEEGLDGTKLRERLGGMLRYLKFDEQLELKKYRDQVKIETGGFGNQVIAGLEKAGRLYNSIPKKYKFIVAAGLVGLTGGSVLAGSAGLATAAGAATLFKRVVATAGLAVTIDSGWEGWQGKKLKEMADIQKDENLDFIFSESGVREGEEDARFRKLREFLDKDLEQIEQKFQAQKKRDKWRRGISWTAANALVFGASAASAAMGGSGITEEARARAELATHGSGGAASAPGAGASAARAVDRAVSAAAASSAPDSASGAAGAASGVPGASLAEGVINAEGVSAADNAGVGTYDYNTGPRIPSVASEVTISEKASALLADHKIVPDGRGLWGVLDKRLEGIPKGPGRDRMIQSLENIMRAKLDAMSPAERAAAGFPKALENGKVNLDFIKVGDTISFSKLLTPQEIQSVLDGKSITAPGVADAASASGKIVTGATQVIDTNSTAYKEVIEREHERMIAQDTIDDQKMKIRQVGGIEKYMDAMRDQAANQSSYSGRMTDPTAVVQNATEKIPDVHFTREMSRLETARFFMANPDLKPAFYSATGKLRMEIFTMNSGEGSAPLAYDYSAGNNSKILGGAKVATVLEDLQRFKNFDVSYDREKNPLHPDQMKELGKFVKATTKAFGSNIAAIGSNENINDYTSRMAAEAVAQHKSIPGFYAPSKPIKLAA